MEFWGVEVKAGEPLKVEPGFDKLLHLSQASLGELKKEKGNESVNLFVKIGDQRIVLGILSSENFPQVSLDLIFEKEFELSHNCKSGSVYFCGYKTDAPVAADSASDDSDDDYFSDDARLALNQPLNDAENGKSEPKAEQAKVVLVKPNAAKPKVKPAEPTKDVTSEEDDDEDDDSDIDDSSDDESKSDEDMLDAEDDSDEGSGDEESEDEDEETPKPKKADPGKKRPTESASKTPVPKKGKLETPQKTDGKKVGGHTATPHPSKQGGKIPASGDKPAAKTPKSGGQVSCKSCSKTFNSDGALQSHSKAKHGGK